MADNNRTQDQNVTGGNKTNRPDNNTAQPSQTGNTQKSREQNPQDGSDWNNYRSREMSDQGGGAGKATTPKSNS